MGRFRLIPDVKGYDADHDDHTPRQVNKPHSEWEFIAEKGEEGAIVVHQRKRGRRTANNNNDWATSGDDDDPVTTDDDYSVGEYQSNQVGLEQGNSGRRIYFQERSEDDCSYETGDDDENHSSMVSHRQRRRYRPLSCFGITPYLVLMIAFLSWWIREGPPAPPMIQDASQQHTTWSSFLRVHSKQWLESSKALFYSTPTHLIKWWAVHIKQDVKDIVQHYYSGSSTTRKVAICDMTIPDESIDNLLVGQERATRAISDALLAWKHGHKNKLQYPMLLYLAGFAGTGRSTLARRLHRLLYKEDDDKAKDCRIPAFIHLKGKDYADASTKQQLIRKLWSAADGGVVLIESAEDMDKGLIAWLVQQLTAAENINDAETTVYAAGDEHGIGSDAPHTLRQQCSQSIFIFTSTIGSRSIARSIKHVIDSSSVLLDLGHEMDKSFESSISERFDAVVPFLPLTQESLTQILQQQVDIYSKEHADTWKSFRLTDSAVGHFLGPDFVEYLSWQYQNRPLLTFASAGAMVLSEKSLVWNRIRALVSRCQLHASVDEAAIMNVVAAEQIVVISWCADNDLTQSCREACRLPL